MSQPIPLYWQGELVGYIAEVCGDNFQVDGKWLPANTAASTQFVAVVEQAMSQWDDTMEGVDVFLEPECRKVVEVTRFDNGEIETLWNPSRWA
jgi:hypothetical protein